MIEEIIKLKEAGLSFRKIAAELDTTVGKVQYCWNKWMNKDTNEGDNNLKNKKTVSSATQTPETLNPLKGALQAHLVTPQKIILHWEVSELPQKIIQLFFTQKFEELVHLIRIYDVSDLIFNGSNAHYFYEIAYSYQNGYWFIKGLSPNRCYLAEIGVKLRDHDFFPILRSNTIQIPQQDPSKEDHLFFNLTQLQNLNGSLPKWGDYVSTYSYYGESHTLEKNNG